MKKETGFAKYIGSGKLKSGYVFLAMQLLGASLKSVFELHKPLEKETVFAIGVQLIDRLKLLHSHNIVHSDLKLENAVMGLENVCGENMVYVIDFGLSQMIEDDNQTSPKKIGRMVGSLRFMGIGAHDGIVAFRNDLESVFYMLLFMLNGDLPWTIDNIKAKTDPFAIANEIKENKKSFFDAPPADLPPEMLRFLDIIKKMSFIERPNYGLLRQVLG